MNFNVEALDAGENTCVVNFICQLKSNDAILASDSFDFENMSEEEFLQLQITRSKQAYKKFCDIIYNYIKQLGFKVTQYYQSNRNSNSYYYRFYPANSSGDVYYELYILLRISDHPLKPADKFEEYVKHVGSRFDIAVDGMNLVIRKSKKMQTYEQGLARVKLYLKNLSDSIDM